MADEESSSHGKVVKVMKSAKPYLLMVGLQFGFAGMYIVSKSTLNHGMNQYVLVVYRNAFAALSLAPFALLLERKTRPKMTIPIFLQIMVLGFTEPILDQGFSYLGMKYTSTSFTSALMNAVPSITFVIALIFRLEKVKMKERRSQAKIIGTMVTFSGTLLMTIYKGPVVDLFTSSKSNYNGSSSGDETGKHWLLGTIFILISCTAWSSFYVMQSIMLKKYPAALSLSALICAAATVQGGVLAVAVEHNASAWKLGWDSKLLAAVYAGVVNSGIAYYVQGAVMKSRGPVFVTAFNPLCMVIVAVLGSCILAETIHLGSIIGAIIIAVGLYSVVWGKSKDYSDSVPPPPSSSSTTTIPKGGEPQELPLTSPNGAKIVDFAGNNSDQQQTEKSVNVPNIVLKS
ncbi:WAT1-related protein At4g08290 [Ziziphus jujuba]|uniref:WAT1-related protein n=2 Tax=Ziziphus jujuba TaxID=326968 RepID=A0A6P3YST7_ZIZJJ|nr:WAT1-related protein At4g08290 [Ziziphus jujuba]KAH7524506.1 hypothetical protein FEM48_Zijuj06G0126600 [Ziziphus jujuba var. spinosa]